MGRAAGTLAVLLALWAAVGIAQETSRPEPANVSTSDSLFRRNTATILLDRNLNTFFWIGRATLDTTLEGTRTSFREQYQATVVQLESDPTRKIQSNQQQANLGLAIPISGPFAASLKWDSFVFTDSRDIGLSRASSNTGLGGFEYTPIDGLVITPLAGYRWENQAGIRDRGPTYLLGATLKPVDLDGYVIDAAGQYREDRLAPRLLENHLLRASIQKSFSEFTRDSLDFGVYRLRRELYSPDSSIESRQEMVVQFTNLLRYTLGPTLHANVFVNLSSRGLDKILLYPIGLRPLTAFDAHIDEFHLDTYVEGQWRSDDGRAESILRFGYGERNELHTILPATGQSTGPLLAERVQQEETKNNLARTTSLFDHSAYTVSGSDQITFDGMMSLLRYDTPSDRNDDDRDELLVALSLGSTHRISRELKLDMSLDGTLSHLVYLHSDLSANNNFNRVLRFYPRTTYTPFAWLTSMNAFEVMASYTVYDFEYAGEAVRSYSYRQFSWIDSTNLDLTTRVGLDGYVYLKLYERGQLRWSDFTERTENSYVDKTFWGQVRFAPTRELLFGIGLKYFSQLRYVHSVAGKFVDSYFRSIGPTCVIRWRPGHHGEIGIRGWYENRRLSDGTVRGLTTLTFNIQMNL